MKHLIINRLFLSANSLWTECRYALRSLARTPGFTAAAVLTLALGIGANTALFGVLNAVLFRPLGYRQESSLVTVWGIPPTQFRQAGLDRLPPGEALCKLWEAYARSFEALATFSIRNFHLTGVDEPERFAGVRVSSSLFPLLGVSPALGRSFQAEDDRDGASAVAVLGYNLWQRRFAGDPAILGRAITLNRKPHTIIGVMPRGFDFPRAGEMPPRLGPDARTEIWLGLGDRTETEMIDSNVLGRLRPGVTAARAQLELNSTLPKAGVANPGHSGVEVLGLREQIVRAVRPALLALQAAVGCVLLVGCGNLALLILARGASRGRELAIRAALGAGRWRILRPLLIENLLLAFSGGLLGLCLYALTMRALAGIAPPNLPRLDAITLDVRVVAFAFALSLAAALVSGLIPAVRASRVDVHSTLKQDGRSGSAGPGGRRREWLMVGEVAMTDLLLAAAGLLIRSFIQMCKVDPGFRPERLVAFDLPRPIVDFNDPNRPSVPLRPFFVEVLRRVGEIPGIESAALANALPLTKRLDLKPIVVEGRAEPVNWNKHDLRVNALIVTPEYFHTLGIPIFRGRAFSIDDRQDAPLVAVINQAMARRFWPAEDPIGKRFRVGVNPNWTTVIGISGSLRQPGSTQTELPGMFRPLAQEEPGWMSLVVRARGDFAGLAREVQRQIWQVDANQPISKVVALEQLLEQSVAFPRFRSLVMGLFAALALLQVTVGIYGLVAYSVARRSHEIGLRLALGAGRGQVLSLVVRQGLKWSAIGVVIGLAAALAGCRLLAGFLFGVAPHDPLAFAVAGAVPLVVALLASCIPARRASRIEPATALRSE